MNKYFIHPLDGRNTNSGLSESYPVQDYSKPGFMAGLVGGYSVLQRRGPALNATDRVVMLASGTPEAPITLGVYGPGTEPARLNGQNMVGLGVFGTDVRHWNIEDFEVYGYTRGGFYFGTTTDGTIPRHIHIDRCVVRDIIGSNDATALQAWGKNITVKNTDIYRIGSDGVWVDGDNFKFINSTIKEVSVAGLGFGDCFQTSKHCDNLHIAGSTFDHTLNSDKQIMVLHGACSSGVIEDSVFLANDTLGSGSISVDGANGLSFRRIRVMANSGVFFLSPTISGEVVDSIFVGNGTGCAVGTSSLSHALSAFRNTLFNWRNGVYFGPTQGKVRNNISHTTAGYAFLSGDTKDNLIINDANVAGLSYDASNLHFTR